MHFGDYKKRLYDYRTTSRFLLGGHVAPMNGPGFSPGTFLVAVISKFDIANLSGIPEFLLTNAGIRFLSPAPLGLSADGKSLIFDLDCQTQPGDVGITVILVKSAKRFLRAHSST